MGSETVQVRALVDHRSGATWHPKGEEYPEEPMRAKDKASRGIVAILATKADAPARNKAAAPSRNKGGRKAKL